jgi:hypothetical protein
MWAEPAGSPEPDGSPPRECFRASACGAGRHTWCTIRTAMRLTTSFLLSALFALSTLSGCLVTTHDHGHRHGAVSRGRACHPSQYWDGHTCRHKGRGHGARKHDGR